MINSDLGAVVTVISHNRSQNVRLLEKVIECQAAWFVGNGEVDAYTNAGASCVFESGGLVDSRNAALHYAWKHDVPCVMVEDDLKGFQLAIDKTHKIPITFHDVVWYLKDSLEVTRNMLYLAGCAPTSNAFFYNPLKRISLNQYIIGSLILVRPCDLWFDPQFKLKEDYDYTLQHIQQFGGVCRRNDILLDVQHYTNSGGAVEYRTEELEQKTIRQLKGKWGPHIVDNPRRRNEVLLKV